MDTAGNRCRIRCRRDFIVDNIYSISATPDSTYLPLVCGRTKDLQELLKYIAANHSVALFGERRIGKTSLLYLLEYIINVRVCIEEDEVILRDSQLKDALADLD